MLDIFGGSIYSDQQVQSMNVIVLLLLLVMGFVFGMVVYVVSRMRLKIKHQRSGLALNFAHSMIIGYVVSAVLGLILYFAS
jgi:heme/copper-type cytochrome/quinol oxidase subunit 2